MAKGLKSLVRVHEWDVDEKRRALGRLLNHVHELENNGRDLELEIVNEQAVAASASEEVGFAYGPYADAAINRREDIARNIAEVEVEIDSARIVLGDAYRELKTYEIAQEERQKKEDAELDRKEQADLDEIGIRGYVRQRNP